jgi:2-polyprenyl-3-methyl-5-hydroxy-6-metoxy-1,4-benzoquinol methylase
VEILEEQLVKIEDYFNEEAEKHDDLFVQKMGMTEFYDEIEHQIDKCPHKNNILVLGCGTGLEIERIRFCSNVTAVDIAEKMLIELKKKILYKGVNLHTVCGSILDFDFGIQQYDIVLSCYVMHHFNEEQKIIIYGKILNCLTSQGIFINGDSMEKDYETEQERLIQAEKVYKENNLPFASLHIDAPFCLEHELEVLTRVGFSDIVLEREWTRTKLYRASKNL